MWSMVKSLGAEPQIVSGDGAASFKRLKSGCLFQTI